MTATEWKLTDYINRIDSTGDQKRVRDCIGILEIFGYSADFDLLGNKYKIVKLDKNNNDNV